jgi:3-oxoacyl-[acyl-carrier protein] reductase
MKKTVLITGGTRGIGLGIARQLAAEGWSLALNGVRPEEQVRATLEPLQKQGAEVLYCQGNIAREEERRAIIQEVVEHYGYLNALVNNAGVGPKERVDLLETSEESFDRVLGINLKGPFFLSQLAAQRIIETKRKDPVLPAAIVNISSISATVVSINRGEYCISKAGLSMVTQLFATRLAEEDIPVYEVRPGIIRTDMTAGVQEKYDRLFDEGLTLQPRWGTPEEVGRAVAALLRGDFPYSTGQVFMVDGGLTVQRL